MNTARQVVGFLRASLRRSVASIGLLDLAVGIIAPIVGRAMNVDLGDIALGLLVAFVAVRVLLLSPAAMWFESQREPDGDRRGVNVQPGGTYIENYYAASETSSTAGTATATVDAADSGTFTEGATVVEVSPAAQRYRRKSKRGSKSPPPLPGF